MVQQQVLLLQQLEQVARLLQRRGQTGVERRELEVGPLNLVGHLAQAVEIDGAFDAVQVLLLRLLD